MWPDHNSTLDLKSLGFVNPHGEPDDETLGEDAMQESSPVDGAVPDGYCGFKPGVFYLTRKAFNALNAAQMAALTSAPAFVVVGGMAEYPLTAEQVEATTGGKPNSVLQYHSECDQLYPACPQPIVRPSAQPTQH